MLLVQAAVLQAGDVEYWSKYGTVYKLNKKVSLGIGGELKFKDNISDFLVFNTGRTGKVKINEKYI